MHRDPREVSLLFLCAAFVSVHRVQDGLHGMLHKIYPLRCCEIRALRLEKNVKLTEAQQTQAQAFAQQPVQSPQTVDAVVIAPEQGTGTEVAEQHEQTPEPVAE